MLIGAFTNWLDLNFLQHVFKIKCQELRRNNEYVTKYYGDEKLPQYLLRLLFVLKRNMQRYLVQLLTCHEWDLLFLFYVHYLLRMLWHRRIESTYSTLIYLNFFMKYVAQLSEDAELSSPGWVAVGVLTCKKKKHWFVAQVHSRPYVMSLWGMPHTFVYTLYCFPPLRIFCEGS